jgi:SNF2 family DNA or RNA helicase
MKELEMLNKNNLHDYQLRGVNHILDTQNVALFLDMGLGKTITTLTAIQDLLYDSFSIKKVLIIAPLRVCNSVWEQEAKNWEHTQELSFINLAGGRSNMLKGLQRSADIYLINRENVKALVDVGKWDFDMVVIDESSSFKSHSSLRFKALKKVLHLVDKMVLLTGTPAPNGYMDLWSQIYLLDKGARLGKNITAYRNRYFVSDFMGWSYDLRPNAEKNIQDKIQDVTLSMSTEDYLELPEFIPTVLNNKLSGSLLKKYNEFKADMLLEVGDEVITAMSAATLTNKLLQFCSGNMYDENGQIHHFHDLKIDTLKEIIEENHGNILVAYNYKHELEALKKAFPEAVVLDKSEKTVEKWNNGEIRLLLAHPASAGHGLNLQHGGDIIVWYGFTWSLELYQQFNKRLHRQGQKNNVRCIHIAVGGIEHQLMKVLSNKDATQQQLLDSLKDI